MATHTVEETLTLAAQAFREQDFAHAVSLLTPAVAAHPGHADLRIALAYSLSRAGQLAASAVHFDAALALRPDDPSLMRDAAQVNLKVGRLAPALQASEAAFQHGHDIALFGQIVDILIKLRRADEALSRVDRLTAQAPHMAALHFIRGVVLGALGRRDEERRAYEDTLARNPRHVDAHTNLGVLARDGHRYDEALRHFKTALSIDPAHAGARNNRAQTNLLIGQFQHGWHDYEWRWQDGGQTRPYPGSPWLGKGKLKGQAVLVHAEQGLGDTLQFSRYVPALREQAGQVIFQVQAPLLRLLRDNFPGITVIANDMPPPAFDRHVPLLSLPLALSSIRATPWPLARTLQADPDAARQWEERLSQRFGPRHARPRIGLAWSGNPTHPDDHNRSIPFADIALLLQASCDFVCIQKDIRDDEREQVEAASRRNLYLPTAALQDFSDTAALLANLDLVVSVDTSTAHLAGSLGVPTRLLLPAMPDWRWQLGRDDTDWYPTMTLLRRPADAAWQAVLEGLLAQLNAMAQAGAAA